MDQATFRKRFLILIACSTGVLLLLAWAFASGAMSMRAFAVAALLWWIASFAAMFPLIRARQRANIQVRQQQIASGVPVDTLDRDRCVSNIRSQKKLSLIFGASLGFILLTPQGDSPVLSVLVVVTLTLALFASLISLLQSQRKLKKLSAISPTPPSATN